REEIENHVLRCAAGVDTRWVDRVWWWAYTLTIPIIPSLPPKLLPEGIVIGDDGIFRLALTEIELVWVGPGEYWLGDERINDLYRVDEPDGFFIARLPVAQDYTQPAALSGMTWQEALDLCERITAIEQLSVSLPSTDQWEIAARGVDSRRYPWGNGYESGAVGLSAPCGALQMVGDTPQWTCSAEDVYLSGGAADRHCGVHKLSASFDEQAAVRPVIRV
ncbi:MAG: SUMF1/EgtB/PvdO family nonheme iron enzyme, partial [Chloroflexi bacterium]|nr:SUMF1/EgtB/PvdO family nonheme iron enzyme [Chloroflexota bacterium]